jgi:signal transduction histidine kinase
MDPYNRSSVASRTDRSPPHQEGRAGSPAPPKRSAFFRQLVIGAQVNLYAVLPLTLFLFVLSEDASGRSLSWFLWVVFVVTNCNVVVVTALYRAARIWRPRSALTYLALGGVILPLAGLFSALIAKLLLPFVIPGPLPATSRSVIAISMLVAILFGLAFYSSQGLRRAQRKVLRQLKSSQKSQYRAEGARDEAQVVSLQSLIKPHFIFNTLDAITTLIHEDPQRAEEVTLRLARLMRYLLELEDGELMSLESEFGVVRAYLEIEKVRMGERLHYEVTVAPELLTLAIPSMVLQPLVENAVKHGVRERDTAGYIGVRAARDGGYCLVEVVDNGPGFGDEKGVGRSMRLVRDRLTRLYGHDYELRLERDRRTAETIATLRLPLVLPNRPPRPAERQGQRSRSRPGRSPRPVAALRST